MPHGSLGHGVASLGDRGGPVGGTLFGRHLEQLLRTIAVKARQREPAVKFVWVRIAQEKVSGLGGLLFGFLAEPALAGFEGFRDGDVALAGTHVGARERQQAQGDYGKVPGNAHHRLTDYNGRKGSLLTGRRFERQ